MVRIAFTKSTPPPGTTTGLPSKSTKPSIDISEIIHPEEVNYGDMYEISFILNKKSRFAPHNISIGIEPVGKEWKLNQLNEDRKFVLKMYGSELRAGENNFKLFINLFL